MELKFYGRFLRRYLVLILGTGVVAAGVAAATTASQPDRFEATTSVLLKVRDTRTLADYDYDQFYVVQATDLYATNVVSWLNSAQLRKDIRESAKAPDGRITVKKNGGTIELTGNAENTDQAVSLVRSATSLIVDRTKTLAPGPGRSAFEAVPTNVADRSVEPQPLKTAGMALAAGLILGLVLALAAEAARPRPRSRT